MVLSFVGTKMLISEIYEIPILIALGVVAAILTISIVASILMPAPQIAEEEIKAPPSD